MTGRFTARALDGAARPLALGEVIHKGGGAGRIVAVADDPAHVVKLYHDPGIAAPYQAKIEAMLARAPALPPIQDGGQRYVQIAWPEAMVEDLQGRFRGFIMPFIDLGQAASLETLLVKALRRHHGLPENYIYRLFAAQNVAAAVAELHRLGHHIIDLKPQNLSIYKRSMYVAVVDCDGLSIDGGDGTRYPAGQFTDGYRAPETVSGRLDPFELGETQDRFALAVVLFQLMNNGIHPFQGVPLRPGDTLGTEQERINSGLYPYGPTPDGRQAPSPGSIHRHFENQTVELFRRAFDSRYRPSAHEWRDHLRDLIEDGGIERCAQNPEEHAHFSKGCGLCAIDAGKQERLAQARERARAQVLAQRPARRARPRIFTRGGGYTVILQRTRQSWSRSRSPTRNRTQTPRVKVKYAQTAQPPATRKPGGGMWRGLLRAVFGSPTRPVPYLPASRESLVYLCIVYGLFALNMLALIGVVTSLFIPFRFYGFTEQLIEMGLMDKAEQASRRENLQLIQAWLLVGVLTTTVVSQFICSALKRAAAGTFVETHAQWLTRTFWLTPLMVITAALLGTATWPYGFIAIACLPFWLLHRLAKGLKALVRGSPILAPTGLI